MRIQSINPFTDEVMKEFEPMDPDCVDGAAHKSRHAFFAWRELSVRERVTDIKKMADHLRAEKMRYAETMTREMGKPIKESVSEIEKCAWLCDYYAENAGSFLRPEQVKTEARKSYVLFQPLGVVLAIMPWNFPFWQVFRCAIPAIAAGNVVILKHSSNVPMCALAIEEAFSKSGFPENIFTTLLIGEGETHRLIEEDRVDAVSLTGSSRSGAEVGCLAGSKQKKFVLELGGSDPFIVLDDADIEAAAAMAAKARMINAGQSCIAAKRFIIMEKAADQFKAVFLSRLKDLKVGDPMDETTDVGPVAKREILDSLTEQIRDAEHKGADVHRVEHSFSKGLFFAPCAVYNPTPDMRVLTEEVFGPIAPVITVRDEDEAIRTANDTEFGLGAAVWSRDLDRAEKVAMKIDAGSIAINDMVKSDPRLPFGGIKKSGVGRELSQYGLKEFVNIKTVVVKE